MVWWGLGGASQVGLGLRCILVAGLEETVHLSDVAWSLPPKARAGSGWDGGLGRDGFRGGAVLLRQLWAQENWHPVRIGPLIVGAV